MRGNLSAACGWYSRWCFLWI